MRLRPALPHVTFVPAFIVLVVACAALTDVLQLPGWVASLLAYGLAAPLALLLALRVGPIGYRGALVMSATSAALALGLAFALWTGPYGAPASSFPWSVPVAIDLALIFFSPVIWLYLIRQLSSNDPPGWMPHHGRKP